MGKIEVRERFQRVEIAQGNLSMWPWKGSKQTWFEKSFKKETMMNYLSILKMGLHSEYDLNLNCQTFG